MQPSDCDSSDLGKICEMCRNYELQLQIVQVNEDGLRTQLAHSQETMKNLKDELRKEQAGRAELEEAFNREARLTERKLQDLVNQLEDSNNRLDGVKGKNKINIVKMSLTKYASSLGLFNDFECDVNLQLAQVMEKKEESRRDVTRLKNENDALLGRNIAKSGEMQSEIINLPQDLNEIHFYLLKLKEDFITTLVAKERNEETLKSERLFIEGIYSTFFTQSNFQSQTKPGAKSKTETV